eukprot:sb/3478274/
MYSRTPIFRAPIYRNPDLPAGKISPDIDIYYRKLKVFRPDIPGTPFYRVNPFPPSGDHPGKSGSDCTLYNKKSECGSQAPSSRVYIGQCASQNAESSDVLFF